MERICVYCGSSIGTQPAYRTAAERLGEALANRSLDLVYGGGEKRAEQVSAVDDEPRAR